MNAINKICFGLFSFLVSCGDPVDDFSIRKTNLPESIPKTISANEDVASSQHSHPDQGNLKPEFSPGKWEMQVNHSPQTPESFTREELRSRHGLMVELQGDVEFIIVGEVKVPWVWFCGTSDHVRNEIVSWSFKIHKIDGKNIVGVVGRDGDFVTWPGAQSYPDGNFPPGYTFFDFGAGVQSSKNALDASF